MVASVIAILPAIASTADSDGPPGCWGLRRAGSRDALAKSSNAWIVVQRGVNPNRSRSRVVSTTPADVEQVRQAGWQPHQAGAPKHRRDAVHHRRRDRHGDVTGPTQRLGEQQNTVPRHVDRSRRRGGGGQDERRHRVLLVQQLHPRRPDPSTVGTTGRAKYLVSSVSTEGPMTPASRSTVSATSGQTARERADVTLDVGDLLGETAAGPNDLGSLSSVNTAG